MPCMIGKPGLGGRHLVVSTLATAWQLLDFALTGMQLCLMRLYSCLERMALTEQCIDS